jgi:hypothetical protein
MSRTYEPVDLGPEPADITPGQIECLDPGLGRQVSFDEAVDLVERAMNRGTHERMCVMSVQEMDFGWLFFLQGQRYLETRQFSHQLVGHGATIVDRRTGAVYGSGSATRPWAAIAAFRRQSGWQA